MTLLRLAVSFLLGLLVAIPVVLEGRSALLLRRGNVISAAAVRPNSPSALSELSEQLAANGRGRDAIGTAADALRTAPLDQQAARQLGLSLIADGRVAEGRNAMALAGAMGWRDTPTLSWQMRDALDRGMPDAALLSADAMARRRRAPPEAFAPIRRVAFAPGGIAKVAALLRDAPPWRADFLKDVSDISPAQVPHYLRLLATSDATADETAPFVRLLADRGAYVDARTAWGRTQPRGGGTGALASDDFAGLGRGDPTPFDWTPRTSADLTASPDPQLRAGQVVLRVEGTGGLAQPVVSQIALASPGPRLLAFEQGPGPAAAPGWTLSCLPSGAALPLSDAGTVAIGGGWRRIARRFLVPASGCAAQRLSLDVGSGISDGFTATFGRVAIR